MASHTKTKTKSGRALNGKHPSRIGRSRTGATLEIVISDRALRDAMLHYSVNIIWLSLIISAITAGLLYFSINRLFVRPMRRLTDEPNISSCETEPSPSATIATPMSCKGGIGDPPVDREPSTTRRIRSPRTANEPMPIPAASVTSQSIRRFSSCFADLVAMNRIPP